MDSRERILALLGLCLRGGNLTVGEEPVENVARARDARLILLAADAADGARRRCQHFAEIGQCLWLAVPFTKAELGRCLGRSAVALAAITDVGLAATVAHRLAETDPEAYADAAERLDVKVKRAAERRAELEAHRKNRRQGRKRKKAAPPRETGQSAPAAPAEAPAKAPGSKPRPAGGRAFNGDRPGKRPGGPRPPHREGGPGPGGQRGKAPARPSKGNRPKPKGSVSRFAHSRPVKKGKGSFRKDKG